MDESFESIEGLRWLFDDQFLRRGADECLGRGWITGVGSCRLFLCSWFENKSRLEDCHFERMGVKDFTISGSAIVFFD